MFTAKNLDEYFNTMKKDIEDKYKIQLEEENHIKIGDYDCKYVEFKSAAQNSSVNFYMQIYIVEFLTEQWILSHQLFLITRTV